MIKTFSEFGWGKSTDEFNPHKLPFKACHDCELLGVCMGQGEVMGTYDCGCSCHETGVEPTGDGDEDK